MRLTAEHALAPLLRLEPLEVGLHGLGALGVVLDAAAEDLDGARRRRERLDRRDEAAGREHRPDGDVADAVVHDQVPLAHAHLLGGARPHLPRVVRRVRVHLAAQLGPRRLDEGGERAELARLQQPPERLAVVDLGERREGCAVGRLPAEQEAREAHLLRRARLLVADAAR